MSYYKPEINPFHLFANHHGGYGYSPHEIRIMLNNERRLHLHNLTNNKSMQTKVIDTKIEIVLNAKYFSHVHLKRNGNDLHKKR